MMHSSIRMEDGRLGSKDDDAGLLLLAGGSGVAFAGAVNPPRTPQATDDSGQTAPQKPPGTRGEITALFHPSQPSSHVTPGHPVTRR